MIIASDQRMDLKPIKHQNIDTATLTASTAQTNRPHMSTNELNLELH